MSFTQINGASNPEAATAAADTALAAASAPTNAPVIHDVPDCNVTLPAGLLDVHGGLTTDAIVRELTGEDEEAIARAGNSVARLMDVILQRGVESIGGKPVDRDTLDRLLAGDRDALLVGIRIATFGPDVALESVRCPSCQKDQNVVIDLEKDVPVKALEDPRQRKFEVELRRGRKAYIALPTGETQRAIAASEDQNYVVLNNILLRKCVTDIGSTPVISDEQIKKLGVADRDTIIKALMERTVGPRLQEVTRPCEACDEVIPLPLSLAGLFQAF
ncbi:MAG: hypothetical protein JWN15_3659 [Firmicutes bacterium]|nr:hypothetical protein [Bacillota bacterium]